MKSKPLGGPGTVAVAIASAAATAGLTLPLAVPAQAGTALRTYNGTASVVVNVYGYGRHLQRKLPVQHRVPRLTATSS